MSELRVLFVSPECAPLTKTGGLGDVSAALPAALREAGIDVRVLLPGYPEVMGAVDAGREHARIAVFDPPLQVRLLASSLQSGVPMYVADCPHLFLRPGGPYQDGALRDWPDNAVRFALLAKVAAILSSEETPLDWHPHVVHCNDWPCGLTPAFLRHMSDPAPTVMTIHNLAFQGNFDPAILPQVGLPWSSFTTQGLEFHGRLSFLKAGLYYADEITTVSPTYALETQSEALGFGMDGLLRSRSQFYKGILNGIDENIWNPETDPLIAQCYGAHSIEQKLGNKIALQRRMALPVDSSVPLLGVVGRLTHQKGTDLLIDAADDLLALGVQLALLGRGDSQYERRLQGLAARFPNAISVSFGFEEELAHLIEAGADMFLMPSRFEPCGLNQMYSQRYGTPPVAHATGGLRDSIVDCTSESLAAGTATGFLYGQPGIAGLVDAVRRALSVHRDSSSWLRIQKAGMGRDFGWRGAAQRYEDLYRQVAGVKSQNGEPGAKTG